MTHVLQDIHSDTRESVHSCPETCVLRLVVCIPNPESDMLPPRSRSNRVIPFFSARQKCTKWRQHLSNKQSKASLWLGRTFLIVALLPLMIILITACFRKCTTEHHGEKVLRSERRTPLFSNVGGSNFMRILGCCSHCERDAWGLSVLMGDGDECKQQLPNPSIQECPPDWNKG